MWPFEWFGVVSSALKERTTRSGSLGLLVYQTELFHAGATYDFEFIRVYGQAGHIKTQATQDSTTTSYELGLAVPFGNSLVLVAYGRQKVSMPTQATTTDRITSIGYDFFLSKRTVIYVAASYEKLGSLSSGNSVAGGVRHKF